MTTVLPDHTTVPDHTAPDETDGPDETERPGDEAMPDLEVVPDQFDDEAELIKVVQSEPNGTQAHEDACAELIRRYQSLVSSCAARYLNSPESQDELTQAGYVGLMNAINHYDPSYGIGLASYAQPCISGEIKRHFRDKRWLMRVRRVAKELRADVLRTESELVQVLNREPTDAEIAERLGRSADEVREGRGADRAFHPMSLDAPLNLEGDPGTYADVIGGEDGDLETTVDMNAVWAHIGELPDREREMLLMRYYGNMTQAQIGERLGISQMHVSRLLRHALDQLQRALTA